MPPRYACWPFRTARFDPLLTLPEVADLLPLLISAPQGVGVKRALAAPATAL